MNVFKWTRLVGFIAIASFATACGSDDTTDPIDNTDQTGGETGGGGGTDTTNPNGSVVVLLPSQVATWTQSVAGPFTFTVPENAVSVTISINGPTDGYVTLADWTDSTGFELVEGGWTNQDPTFCLSCNNRIASAEGSVRRHCPQQSFIATNTRRPHVFGVWLQARRRAFQSRVTATRRHSRDSRSGQGPSGGP